MTIDPQKRAWDATQVPVNGRELRIAALRLLDYARALKAAGHESAAIDTNTSAVHLLQRDDSLWRQDHLDAPELLSR